MRHGSFQGFGRAEARDLVAWLTPVTQANRKPGQLASLLVGELRRRRILLPTPRVLELVIHHARIRAERGLHRTLIDRMDPVQIATLDELLAVPAGGGGPSRIAWLRQAPGSPAARNLAGLIERVRTVRAIGLDRNREAAVPPAASWMASISPVHQNLTIHSDQPKAGMTCRCSTAAIDRVVAAASTNAPSRCRYRHGSTGVRPFATSGSVIV